MLEWEGTCPPELRKTLPDLALVKVYWYLHAQAAQ